MSSETINRTLRLNSSTSPSVVSTNTNTNSQQPQQPQQEPETTATTISKLINVNNSLIKQQQVYQNNLTHYARQNHSPLFSHNYHGGQSAMGVKDSSSESNGSPQTALKIVGKLSAGDQQTNQAAGNTNSPIAIPILTAAHQYFANSNVAQQNSPKNSSINAQLNEILANTATIIQSRSQFLSSLDSMLFNGVVANAQNQQQQQQQQSKPITSVEFSSETTIINESGSGGGGLNLGNLLLNGGGLSSSSGGNGSGSSIDTNKVEEIPAKEPDLKKRPKKSALKKEELSVSEQFRRNLAELTSQIVEEIQEETTTATTVSPRQRNTTLNSPSQQQQQRQSPSSVTPRLVRQANTSEDDDDENVENQSNKNNNSNNNNTNSPDEDDDDDDDDQTAVVRSARLARVQRNDSLARFLRERPQLAELQAKNIVPTSTDEQRKCEREEIEIKLDRKLSLRPTPWELEQRNILHTRSQEEINKEKEETKKMLVRKLSYRPTIQELKDKRIIRFCDYIEVGNTTKTNTSYSIY